METMKFLQFCLFCGLTVAFYDIIHHYFSEWFKPVDYLVINGKKIPFKELVVPKTEPTISFTEKCYMTIINKDNKKVRVTVLNGEVDFGMKRITINIQGNKNYTRCKEWFDLGINHAYYEDLEHYKKDIHLIGFKFSGAFVTTIGYDTDKATVKLSYDKKESKKYGVEKTDANRI